MRIFLYRHGTQTGPFELDQVRGMLASGMADPGDLAWTDGLPQWKPLGQLLAGEQAGPAPGAAPPSSPPPSGPDPAWSPPAWTPPSAPSGRAYAGFWVRVAASIIDSLVVSAGAFLLMLPLAVPLGLSRAFSDTEDIAAYLSANLVFSLMSVGLQWIYYAFQESSAAQATLGKRAMGIVVTDLHGQRLSFARASGRYFANILTGLTLGIGYLMCLWTSRRQCLHDLLAETLVLRK
jgi:uncharacterized RDD family membrane protein YckC